jgi:hypothetical protein
MTRNELTMMALEAASGLTGAPVTDAHTQHVAFHLFCVAMAEEAANRGLTAEGLRAQAVQS